MDFGFGKFLEMFEERFGHVPTTVLLGLIGLAVIIFCLSIILSGTLSVIDFLTETPPDKTIQERLFYEILPTLVVLGLTYFVFKRLFVGLSGKVKKLIEKAEGILKELDKEINQIEIQSNKEMKNLDRKTKK